MVFNKRMDDLQSNSIHSVQSGYPGSEGGPAVLGAPGTTILNKIPGIPCFSSTEREKTLFGFNSGIMLFPMLEGILMNN